ncbi:hypothetical protein MMC09_006901 [Bachmanniomyces sp. S44760]|nr:hypothetical protein [Bachmanniomyces sp. S44760]
MSPSSVAIPRQKMNFTTLILLFVAAVTLFLYKLIVYPLFLSPLSTIPNAHPSSAVSPIWILWIRYMGSQNETLYQLHQKLGPIIRVAPRELSVNCVKAGVRRIYAGGFEKHSWYPNQFNNYGVPNMFSTAASKPHSIRKRMISNVYSKSYLQSSTDMHKISQILLHLRYLPILEATVINGDTVDVQELNFAVTMDFINGYIFGLDNGSNFLQDVTTRKEWLDLYQSRKSHTFWASELPRLTSICHKFGFRLTPKWVDKANRDIENWCLQMCNKAAASHKVDSSTPPVVFRQLAESLRKDPANTYPMGLTIASETLDHLAAGHETSGITLTYLMYELSQRLSMQAALRAELMTLDITIQYNKLSGTDKVLPELPSPKAIDALPLLDAIIVETLRLHAAIPGPQPRVTPCNGTALGTHTSIPKGIRVASLAWALHRNSEVFPEPLEWIPERWLEESNEAERRNWFWAFSSGGRMCIGSNFAMQGMFTRV